METKKHCGFDLEKFEFFLSLLTTDDAVSFISFDKVSIEIDVIHEHCFIFRMFYICGTKVD